jgi:Putative lumazine-binding
MSAAQPATSKIADFDAITIVMNLYTQGVRTGRSAAMKPAFHDAATFFGYYQGQLLAGPIQILFDWVDGNGPSEGIQARITSVDMCETIAVVSMDMTNMTGKLTGEGPATLSDRFQLIKVGSEWKITQKSFHWF